MLFKSPTGEVVQVKVGFSWQAFFVGSFRALVARTWLTAVILIGGYLALARMGRSFPASSRSIALLLVVLVLYVGYMALCGVYGNRWLVTSLLRRGYRKIDDEPA